LIFRSTIKVLMVNVVVSDGETIVAAAAVVLVLVVAGAVVEVAVAIVDEVGSHLRHDTAISIA
jgi:hypothetical protein